MTSSGFHEDWFSEESQQVLVELYRQVERISGAIVEVGCWEGRSTVALANACAPFYVRAIDTWKGSPGEISEQLAAERDVFKQFQLNIARYTTGNVFVHRMDWRDWFTNQPEPIRLLHIDAAHTYDEVHDNIVAAVPLMVPGGIICGDDVLHPPVQKAVADTLGAYNVMCKASLWYWTKP